MEQKWKIIYYKTINEKSPVEEFILSLNVKAQNKIVDTLTLLREFGINLGLPHVKKLTGTHMWELRILGQDNLRIFYVTQIGKVFLLLHGFQKKKQKTDKKEIKTALKRLIEHQLRNKN